MVLAAREEANLRRALGVALAHNLRAEISAIAEALDSYLQSAARVTERQVLAAWVHAQLPTLQQLDEPGCAAICNHAWSWLQQGEVGKALGELERLIRRLEQEGVSEGAKAAAFQLAVASSYLGRIYYFAGRADLAVAPLQRAIAGFEAQEQDELVQTNLAAALGDLANVQRYLGELGAALETARRALAIMEALERKREIAAGHGMVAQILRDQGRYGEAEGEYQLALQAAREAGDRDLEAAFLQHMGGLKNEQGDPGAAIGDYKQALALFQAAGDEGSEMQTCDLLGTAELRRSQLDAAEAWYTRARELALKLKDLRQLATTSQNLGILHQDRAMEAAEPQRSGLLRRAVELVGEALTLFKELQDPVYQAASHSQLGILYRLLGELDPAEANARQALQIRAMLSLPEIHKDYASLAEIAQARGDEAGAATWQAKADAKEAELDQLAQGPKAKTPGKLEGLSPRLHQVMQEVCQAVHAARQGVRLEDRAAERLTEMAAGTGPWPAVAAFLRAAADPGQGVPAVPDGLPADLEQLLAALREAPG